MKNWFTGVDPSKFAQTQNWYIKQIDQYIKSMSPVRNSSKAYFGKNTKEILNKIKKGFQIGEDELKKVSKNKTSVFGSTQLYNSYVIKLLSNFDDPYLKQKYDGFVENQKSKEPKKSNVYSRMRKDVVRRETIYLQNNNLTLPTENISKFSSFRSFVSDNSSSTE